MRELFVDSVYKTFGTHSILSDIYISCKPGDIIGLLGRNGSGKSTLLKIIFGSLQADHKFVRVNGKVVRGTRENKISYLPQHNFLPSHLKITSIIDLLCSSSRTASIKNHEHVKSFLNYKTKDLSGGERRMIEILLILNSSADYILMDEPFHGVEPIHKNDVKELIQKNACEKGFIITDHDYRSIMDVATKTLLLHEGGIRQIGTNDELTNGKYLSQSFF